MRTSRSWSASWAAAAEEDPGGPGTSKRFHKHATGFSKRVVAHDEHRESRCAILYYIISHWRCKRCPGALSSALQTSQNPHLAEKKHYIVGFQRYRSARRRTRSIPTVGILSVKRMYLPTSEHRLLGHRALLLLRLALLPLQLRLIRLLRRTVLGGPRRRHGRRRRRRQLRTGHREVLVGASDLRGIGMDNPQTKSLPAYTKCFAHNHSQETGGLPRPPHQNDRPWRVCMFLETVLQPQSTQEEEQFQHKLRKTANCVQKSTTSLACAVGNSVPRSGTGMPPNGK